MELHLKSDQQGVWIKQNYITALRESPPFATLFALHPAVNTILSDILGLGKNTYLFYGSLFFHDDKLTKIVTQPFILFLE